jgi:hypothetical protein
MKSLKRLSFVIVALLIVVLSNKTSVSAETQYSENVIPKMTSNTSPSGVASASSKFNDNVLAWRAFDHDVKPYGWAVNFTGKDWLEYEFAEARCIEKYTLQIREPYSSLKEAPQNWTFEAWDSENSTWVVLDKQTGIANWSAGVKKEFTFINTKSYKKYRIYITKNGGEQGLAIGEMEMMESINTVPDKKLKVVLEVKEQLQLSVEEDLDENLEMIWTSSNDTVAIVDANGVVTALAPGNTMISVTSADGTYTDYINVLVVDDAKDYRLAVDLKVGKSCRLTVDDLTDTVKVNWSSLDPTVATVSSKGKVTAVSEGLTVVIATDEEGNEIGQIYIRVRE